MPTVDRSCCAQIYDGKRRLAGGATWGAFTLPLGAACATVLPDSSRQWVMRVDFHEDPEFPCNEGNPGDRQNGQYTARIRVCNADGVDLRFDAIGYTEMYGLRWPVDAIVVWVDGIRVLQGSADSDGVQCQSEPHERCATVHLDPGEHTLSIAMDTIDGLQNLDGMYWQLTLTLLCGPDPGECEAGDGLDGPDVEIGEPNLDGGGGDDQGGPGAPGDPPGGPPGGDGLCVCGCFFTHASLEFLTDSFPEAESCSFPIGPGGVDGSVTADYTLDVLNGQTFVLDWVEDDSRFYLELAELCTTEPYRGIKIAHIEHYDAGTDKTIIYEVYLQAIAILAGCFGLQPRCDTYMAPTVTLLYHTYVSGDAPSGCIGGWPETETIFTDPPTESLYTDESGTIDCVEESDCTSVRTDVVGDTSVEPGVWQCLTAYDPAKAIVRFHGHSDEECE